MTALRILLVEDDSLIGLLLGDMLESMGYEICAIEATEANAVIAAALHHPGLMIVDAGLCEGSGIGAVDEILRCGPVPFLFTSGDSLGVRLLKPDAVVIQKPFREFELAAAIERALAQPTLAN
jgi:DNA-binding response OmpR family regulator